MNFIKLSKAKARQYFEHGRSVFLQSSKISPYSELLRPCEININSDIDKDKTFDAIVNAYAYYNCDPERGRRVSFYINDTVNS